MKTQINKLVDFQVGFGLTCNPAPVNLPEKEAKLRYDMLDEENKEYLDAVADNNMVEIADALGDQLYLVLGSIVSHGLQHKIIEVFDAIHDSNMSKLDENGKPLVNGQNGVFDSSKPMGKVLKSPQYFKPTDRIKNILK